uniref:Uncharacterized protein n=1 Tax=Anguilla anguilla TaxID=7936 RepID=A0A0E9UTL7_ANGAN
MKGIDTSVRVANSYSGSVLERGAVAKL